MGKQSLAMVLRTGIELFGYAGAIFVLYGAYASWWQQPWPPLERIALPVSSGLTLFGTLVTAASVYLHAVPSTRPEGKSLYVTAPLVIASTLAALGVLVHSGVLPPVTVNGFAMLGIAGAMFRIQPRPRQFGVPEQGGAS